eukprot:sb/3471305/
MNPSAWSKSKTKTEKLELFIDEQAKSGITASFVCVTETWLKGFHCNEQIVIPGYNVTRSDRSGRVGGGVLLYSADSIPISASYLFDDGVCEATFCEFETINAAVAVVYRPPNASVKSTNAVLTFVNHHQSTLPDNCDFFLSGDFNSPGINWIELSASGKDTVDVGRWKELTIAYLASFRTSKLVEK